MTHDSAANVVGTSSEPWDKVFTFRNHGNASTLVGCADHLQIYNRAATPVEVTAYIVLRIGIAASSGVVFVSVPSVLTGYQIQTAVTPGTPASWSPLAQVPARFGEFFVWPRLTQGTSEFYRLVRK